MLRHLGIERGPINFVLGAPTNSVPKRPPSPPLLHRLGLSGLVQGVSPAIRRRGARGTAIIARPARGCAICGCRPPLMSRAPSAGSVSLSGLASEGRWSARRPVAAAASARRAGVRAKNNVHTRQGRCCGGGQGHSQHTYQRTLWWCRCSGKCRRGARRRGASGRGAHASPPRDGGRRTACSLSSSLCAHCPLHRAVGMSNSSCSSGSANVLRAAARAARQRQPPLPASPSFLALAHSPPPPFAAAGVCAGARAAAPMTPHGDGAHSPPPAKRARVGEQQRVVPAPAARTNLIEVDGKSCTHEVAWPPGEAGGERPAAADLYASGRCMRVAGGGEASRATLPPPPPAAAAPQARRGRRCRPRRGKAPLRASTLSSWTRFKRQR